eukprot:COSAG01_NODE_3935_length_5518_cov_3.286769_8_plen_65_part_00
MSATHRPAPPNALVAGEKRPSHARRQHRNISGVRAWAKQRSMVTMLANLTRLQPAIYISVSQNG